jgi:hypothetical protein
MAEALQVGSVCVTGENSRPRFRVIALVDDRAWIRDVETGQDSVVASGHCHAVPDTTSGSADAPSSLPQPVSLREGAPMPTSDIFPDGSPRP